MFRQKKNANCYRYITILICRLYSSAATLLLVQFLSTEPEFVSSSYNFQANKSLIGAGIAKFLVLFYTININILHIVQASTQYQNITSHMKQKYFFK